MITSRVKVKKTPTEKYPDMVTVVTNCKKYKTLNNRRFINAVEVNKQVELIRSYGVVTRITKKVIQVNSEYILTETW